MTRQPTSAQMPTCAKETAARLCEDENITRQHTSAQMTTSAEETAACLCEDEMSQIHSQGKESQPVKLRLNKTLRWIHDDISLSIARKHWETRFWTCANSLGALATKSFVSGSRFHIHTALSMSLLASISRSLHSCILFQEVPLTNDDSFSPSLSHSPPVSFSHIHI